MWQWCFACGGVADETKLIEMPERQLELMTQVQELALLHNRLERKETRAEARLQSLTRAKSVAEAAVADTRQKLQDLQRRVYDACCRAALPSFHHC